MLNYSEKSGHSDEGSELNVGRVIKIVRQVIGTFDLA
jgi:hypothetical protein